MQLATYYQKDYSGGLNNTSSPREIGRNEASVLENWDITTKGRLSQRDGLTLVAPSVGTSSVVGLYSYLRSTGGRDLLVTAGSTLFYLNGSTLDPLDTGFTSELDTWMETCPLNDKVYISNGTDVMHSWDRSSVVANAALTELATTIPNGLVLKWHKNHMFTLNSVRLDTGTYTQRLYWSLLGDPETWDTTNDFIELPGGGAAVTLGDLGDSLVIFKERSISFLQGWGDVDWRITASSSNVANIDEAVGTLSPRGGTRVGNEWWFMDDEGFIRRIYQTDFDAFRKDIISSKVQGTLDTLNKSQIAKVEAWTQDDKVYFAIPTGTSTINDTVLVYDLIASKRTGEEAWTTYTGWEVGRFASHATGTTPTLYIGSGSTGKVYTHTGATDDGVAVSARWDGKQDDFDKPERRKRYFFGYISGVAGGSAEVDIHSSVDGSAFAPIGTLELAGSGSRLGPTGSFLLGPTGDARLGGATEGNEKFYYQEGGGIVGGKSLQHSIRHSGSGQQPQVNGFSSHYRERVLR